MKKNYRNLIVDNIFSEEEIKDIYLHLENTTDDKKKLIEEFGHIAYFSWMPEHIVNTIVEAAQEATNKQIELQNLSFARYQVVNGKQPLLFPHVDETFKEPRLTFDIQLKASIDWPLVVEGRSFTLKDNQALTFSGTHQVHWRDHIVFGEDDYADMIFCHFSEVGVEKNTLGDDHYMPLMAERDAWATKYWENRKTIING